MIPSAPVADLAELAGLTGLAHGVIGLLSGRGETVVVAESLTGGLVAAALTSVPGSSAAFRGGIVAYAADLKESLLGVSAVLLATEGTVHPDVAAAMAVGARDRLGADVGLATTGVAGPEAAEGRPVGTVYVAIATSRRTRVESLTLSGGRAWIRESSARVVLNLVGDELREDPG